MPHDSLLSDLASVAPASPEERERRYEQVRSALAIVSPHFFTTPRPRLHGTDLRIVFTALDLYLFRVRYFSAFGNSVVVFAWRTGSITLTRESWIEHYPIDVMDCQFEIVLDPDALSRAFAPGRSPGFFDGRPARDEIDAVITTVAHRMAEAVAFYAIGVDWSDRDGDRLERFLRGPLRGLVYEGDGTGPDPPYPIPPIRVEPR